MRERDVTARMRILQLPPLQLKMFREYDAGITEELKCMDQNETGRHGE